MKFSAQVLFRHIFEARLLFALNHFIVLLHRRCLELDVFVRVYVSILHSAAHFGFLRIIIILRITVVFIRVLATQWRFIIFTELVFNAADTA